MHRLMEHNHGRLWIRCFGFTRWCRSRSGCVRFDAGTSERHRTGVEILTLLKALNEEHGKTLLMVTHDPRAAEFASRVVHLDNGAIAADEKTPEAE